MQRARVNKARNKRIQQGRRADQVAKNPRYYFGLHDHPTSRAFGPVEYIDQEGREYQRANVALVRSEHPVPLQQDKFVTLYVKLRKGVPWFPGNVVRPVVTLAPVDVNEPVRRLRIHSRSILLPGHRSGHVTILRSDWEQ